MIHFSKYSGCGNDFILIDQRQPINALFAPSFIQALCHRQKGIGADGIIFLENSARCDAKMRIFNADGSEAEMCGNGMRCFAKFLFEIGFPKKKYLIETMHRELTIEPTHDDEIKTLMGEAKDLQLDFKIDHETLHYTDTGVPHAVIFVENLAEVDVYKKGQYYRNHPRFQPQGANINFVEIKDKQTIAIRTYERGVENETLACGTGAAGCAIITAIRYNTPSPIIVETRSGESMKIDFVKDFQGNVTTIYQTGPAKKHFTGSFELNSFKTF